MKIRIHGIEFSACEKQMFRKPSKEYKPLPLGNAAVLELKANFALEWRKVLHEEDGKRYIYVRCPTQ